MLDLTMIINFFIFFFQSIVFHVSEHPDYPGFWQCVSFGFFNSQAEETAYNLFCVFAMYFVPLIVIIFAYTCILWEISKKTRETRGKSYSIINIEVAQTFIYNVLKQNVFLKDKRYISTMFIYSTAGPTPT